MKAGGVQSADERWREIARNAKYRVSSLGRVKRVLPGPGAVVGRVLRTGLSRGYAIVGLYIDGRLRTVPVAAIVAEAFIGPRPPGLEINHINGIKTDNRAENLEYVTKSQNARHAYALGLATPTMGERNGHAKLTEADVVEIRRRASLGEAPKALARSFGIDRSSVSLIVRRETWGHV